eukprot:293980_1
MLSTFNTSDDSSPHHSYFVPHEPPLKKRRLIDHSPSKKEKSESPQFVLQNINGEFKLVVSNNKPKATDCIDLITDNENDSNTNTNTTTKKTNNRKYIDLCSSPQTKPHNENSKPECISLLTSDGVDSSNDNIKINKKSNHNKPIEFHQFLNKPIMNDACDKIYSFFKDIINKYKDNISILSSIEIEGRIGMLLKKKAYKNNKHRNNRHLRVANDIFINNNKQMIKIYATKQKGHKFDSDVKKQTFFYFKTVMNGLYINSLCKNNYPFIEVKFTNKIMYKYNYGFRVIEYITNI